MPLKYCGFCHTDVHLANNDWKLPGFEYPAVVGHEIAGIVTKAGENVKAILLIILISYLSYLIAVKLEHRMKRSCNETTNLNEQVLQVCFFFQKQSDC